MFTDPENRIGCLVLLGFVVVTGLTVGAVFVYLVWG
jgi:hypothetical protein